MLTQRAKQGVGAAMRAGRAEFTGGAILQVAAAIRQRAAGRAVVASAVCKDHVFQDRRIAAE